MAPPPKHSRHEIAQIAARARWGPARVVRLDDLTPEQRRLVACLVACAKAAAKSDAA